MSPLVLAEIVPTRYEAHLRLATTLILWSGISPYGIALNRNIVLFKRMQLIVIRFLGKPVVFEAE